jgi:hypothetical protein
MKSSTNNINTDSYNFKSIGKIAYIGFKDYWRLFIGALLFSFLSFIVAVVITIMIFMGIMNSFHVTLSDLIPMTSFNTLIYLTMFFPSIIILYSCLGSLYGISREIIISGDYYANVKSVIFYFRKYWWQYTIATIFIKGVSICLSLFFTIFIMTNWQSLWYLNIIIIGMNFVWETLFNLIMPSVSAGNSIKKSFHECLQLIHGNYRNIIKTYGFYYLLLQLIILIYTLIPAEFTIVKSISAIIVILSNYLFVPFLSMISTLLYYQFKRINMGNENVKEMN